MARPKKQEVDYFPHYCDHGKVLFILENHFKNDGYAVFYKIEELLAKTEGHCYDCSGLESWEYLLSKMGTSEETVIAILNKLSAMKIIDGPLWAEKRIWMQSFVDSISDVYGRRVVDLPIKPELLHTETPLNRINDNNNPQSKLKESKVKETKGGDSPLFSQDEIKISPKKTIPPSIEEVIAYCLERKNNIDPEAWMAFYNSNGWMVGKNKMKDWKSAIITWEKRGITINNQREGVRI